VTKYENLLYKALQDEGFTVTRQKEFSYEDDQGNQNSIEVDLSIDEYYLAIEVDGRHHNQDDQRERDSWRDRTIQKNGYKVVHFQNSEVMADIEGLIDEVYDLITSTSDKSKEDIRKEIDNSSDKEQEPTTEEEIASIDFDTESESSENSTLQKMVGITLFVLAVGSLTMYFGGYSITDLSQYTNNLSQNSLTSSEDSTDPPAGAPDLECEMVCHDYCVEKSNRENKSFDTWFEWDSCVKDTCGCGCKKSTKEMSPHRTGKIVPEEKPQRYSDLNNLKEQCGEDARKGLPDVGPI
jgi:very-short-patch-repair endonuclease